MSVEVYCDETTVDRTYTDNNGNILKSRRMLGSNVTENIYEYDSNGNVTKEVDKTKRDNSDPEEDIKVIMQMYKEMLEKEQKYMLEEIKEIINEE